jgi:hypothetical protein
MAIQDSDLAVRRHERYGSAIPARLLVSPATALRLSSAAIGTGGSVNASVVDISRGGIGISSPVYFPLTSQLRVTFALPGSAAPIEALVRIQRVAMSDVKPTYYLGGSLEAPKPELERAFAAALTFLRDSGAPILPEKSRV